MKREKKEKYGEKLIELYKITNEEIEFLKRYYKTTYEGLKEKQVSVKTKYSIGEKIASIFDNILDKKSFKIDEKKLKEANKQIIFENVKFSEIIKKIWVNGDNKKSLLFSMYEQYDRDEINPKISSEKIIEVFQYEKILLNSMLSNLIITFESSLSRLFYSLVFKNQTYLKDKSVALNKFIFDDNNFVETVLSTIGEFVDGKMYDSLDTLLEIINSEDLYIQDEILSSFKEIYYRRNIIVHNEGKINKRYLKSVDQQYKKDIKEGQELICDKTYLDFAFTTVTKLIFFLYYGILQKYDNEACFIDEISNLAFKRLEDEDYEIAKTMYDIISKNKNIEFLDRMMAKINYLNALKQLGDLKTLTEELKLLDVSIATDNFKIAKLCLQNNNTQIYKMLSKTYPESFNAESIKNWPIFIDFRKSQEYIKFCEEHSNDFHDDSYDLLNQDKGECTNGK